jgi:multidrug efflux pump subunit AcrB
MKSLIEWWSKNHLAANFLMLAIFIGGALSWFKMRKEIFPEISTNFIVVRIPYPNATPSEVEKGVVVPVEESVADLEGIKRITSNSSESVGSVIIEGQNGYDVDTLVTKIKSRVDGITNLAEEAEEPVVEAIPLKSQILSIAITAPTDARGLRSIAEQLRDQLLSLDEVTQVEIAGAKRFEVGIEVSEDTLRRYGMTFDQVATAVRQASLDLPAGSVKTDSGEILIRTSSRRYTAEDMRNITVLTRPDGRRVALHEVANIVDGFEEIETFTRFDGKAATVLDVYRMGNEDTLEVAAATKKFLQTAEGILPQGTKLEVWNDMSLMLKGRMELMRNDAITGFFLVAALLTLFLRPALALNVAVGIPIAFFGGAMLMPLGDVSINMISLFAFIVVLGIVTDDAIVVGENVYERMRRGEPARIAAHRGTHEVMVVAMFGVFTVICSFAPMLMISGVSGQVWKNIPWVVIPTLIISLVETNFILPAHLAMLKPEKPDDQVGGFIRLQRRITKAVDRFIEKVFRPFLGGCLQRRYLTFGTFIAVSMVIVGLVIGGRVKFEFFPKVEGEVICAKLTMANGVPGETTTQAVERMDQSIQELNATYKAKFGKEMVRHRLANLGTQPFKLGFQPASSAVANNIGEVTLELIPATERTITADQIVADWRKLIGPLPGLVEISFFANTSRSGNAFDLELHSTNQGQLEAATAEFKQKLAAYPGATDIADNNREGKNELRLGITPVGESLGLRLGELTRQVRQAFYGEEIQRLQRGRDEVKVMVRYPLAERKSLENLEEMKLRLPDGLEVPFSQVATGRTEKSYASIYRAERQRAFRVTGDIDRNVPGANANEIVASLEKDVFPEIKRKYPEVHWGFQGEQKDQRQSMSELGTGFVLCLLGIFVLLAIPLRSLLQPFIVMAVIPFGAVGAIVGHMLLGLELSIMSMIGIVALSGVVVNESLVLVEFVNRNRHRGRSILQAAKEGGAARFQAIMLTSIASFIGVMPIVLETDLQAKFLIPCGVALAFGCLFNMLNTLVLVPCLYAILEDLKRLFFTRKKLERDELVERIEAAERGLSWD